jgi:hypothetical protein
MSLSKGDLGFYALPFIKHYNCLRVVGAGEHTYNLPNVSYDRGGGALTHRNVTESVLYFWFLTNFIKTVYNYLSGKLLLGIYIVNSSYFLSNDIYFPSIDNIRVFTSSCFINAPAVGGLLTSNFGGNGKFFSKYHGYNKRGYLGSSRRAELSIRNSKLSVKHTKSIKSKLLFLKDYLRDPSVSVVRRLISHFSRFFRRNRLSGYKVITDRSIRSLTTVNKIHSNCKTFKLSQIRVRYFSEFECIYNPSIIDTTHTVVKKSQFTWKYLTNKSNLEVTKRPHITQSIFKSVKNVLLRKYLVHSNVYFMPFCFKLAYFFGSSIYPTTKVVELGSNLIPNYNCFNYKLVKHIHSAGLNYSFRENVTPWVYNTVIRFMEYFSGKKVCLDMYSFMSQSIDTNYIALYKSWLPRFSYYERRLGHRFFLEEALQILHMGFNYQDSKLISSWLKSLIQRISFWKTRFIFRFIRYLFNNYFQYMFSDIGVKGFKVRLKGKISVAGNSRKRSILYRVGKTSHTTVGLKVAHSMDTITTFTGVMGFQVWIFY